MSPAEARARMLRAELTRDWHQVRAALERAHSTDPGAGPHAAAVGEVSTRLIPSGLPAAATTGRRCISVSVNWCSAGPSTVAASVGYGPLVRCFEAVWRSALPNKRTGSGGSGVGLCM